MSWPNLTFARGLYFCSKATRVTLARGMIQRPRPRDRRATRAADTMYGTIIRWKLVPQERMAMISEFCAILDVKRITVRNTTIGLYMFMKYGMKFR